MSKAGLIVGLTLGVLLIIFGSILCLLWFPIIEVDSPSEAAEKTGGSLITDRIPVRFKGKISGFDTVLGYDVMYVEGFGDSLGGIPIVYDKNASIGVGDEVLVEGKYTALILRCVCADKQGVIEPATIRQLPLPIFYLAIIILIGGIVLVAVSTRI